MEYVQLTLTTTQTDILSKVCRLVSINAPEQLDEQLTSLASFFEHVTDEPRAFPVTGRMATSLKKRARQMKKLGR